MVDWVLLILVGTALMIVPGCAGRVCCAEKNVAEGPASSDWDGESSPWPCENHQRSDRLYVNTPGSLLNANVCNTYGNTMPGGPVGRAPILGGPAFEPEHGKVGTSSAFDSSNGRAGWRAVFD